LKKPPPTSSWRVEPTTKDGKRWSNGVRLASKEEAVAYRDHHACYELEEAGYVTADILARRRSAELFCHPQPQGRSHNSGLRAWRLRLATLAMRCRDRQCADPLGINVASVTTTGAVRNGETYSRNGASPASG
jgi:hypothetical protein